MNDRNDCVHWLPSRQFFMPSPIVPRNVSRMDCCTQFLFRERPERLAVFGNVNRVFQTFVQLVPNKTQCEEKRSPLFELARVLVRSDPVASIIVSTNHIIV